MGRHIESAERKISQTRIVYPAGRVFKTEQKKLKNTKYTKMRIFPLSDLHNKYIKVLHTETEQFK